MKSQKTDKSETEKELPKHLYRYIPFEYLAEMLITRSIPVLRPKNWDDQHDLKNSLKNVKENSVVGIVCFTEKWETSFHWNLFAKYGVRLTFDGKNLQKRIKESGATLDKVTYVSHEKYIKRLIEEKSLLFYKRNQYKPEREWRLICQVHKNQIVSDNIVKRIPFEWEDLKKITFSPYYEISDYHFHKAMILKMLKAVGASNVNILRSSLFESKKINDAELDLEGKK